MIEKGSDLINTYRSRRWEEVQLLPISRMLSSEVLADMTFWCAG